MTNENYLACVDYDRLGTTPIYTLCRTTEGPRNPTYISDTRVVCSTRTGALNVFSFASDKKELAHTTTLRGVHSREVREIGVCPNNSHYLASTGPDRELCVTDLESRTLLVKTKLAATGGSLKWTGYAEGGLGITLDTGFLLFFDPRAGLSEPVLNINSDHKELYTQSRYGPHHVLLGYSNGDLLNMDIRTGEIISRVEDYYCEGIGMIEHGPHHTFVTSGFADFTVWRHNADTLETNIWSHRENHNILNNDVTLTYCASYVEDDVVLATNSRGYIGTWKQNFLGLGI